MQRLRLVVACFDRLSMTGMGVAGTPCPGAVLGLAVCGGLEECVGRAPERGTHRRPGDSTALPPESRAGGTQEIERPGAVLGLAVCGGLEECGGRGPGHGTPRRDGGDSARWMQGNRLVTSWQWQAGVG
ncbi:MAG: hypothetical protein AMXMBFR61_20340 [Fimbriimonadales bacterium]